MRRRFFVEGFNGSSALVRGETADHLCRVLRAQPGQQYELSDGERVWLARIERVSLPKRGEPSIEFALVEPVEARASALHVSLLISLIKFDRFEWCLEKATELGVDEIVPLSAARTDKTLIAAAAKRRDRWSRILLESAQQSRRLRPPVFRDAVRPAEAFAGVQEARKILLSERTGTQPLRNVLAAASSNHTVALAFGPEGGWTDHEIEAAGAASFASASLGDNILRAETAIIATLAFVQFTLGQ